MKKLWLRNTRTDAVGYLVREVNDTLVEVKVPTLTYGDQQRFWKCFEYIARQRRPRSDRGKAREKPAALRLVASR